MTKRLNLAVPERTMDRLEDLKKLTEASSVTDVIKQAIITHESIALHLARGVKFFAKKPGGEIVEVEFMIDVPRQASLIQLVKENEVAAAK